MRDKEREIYKEAETEGEKEIHTDLDLGGADGGLFRCRWNDTARMEMFLHQLTMQTQEITEPTHHTPVLLPAKKKKMKKCE